MLNFIIPHMHFRALFQHHNLQCTFRRATRIPRKKEHTLQRHNILFLSAAVLQKVISCPLHRKKRFTSFPSPAGMSLTKLPLGRNNSVMTSLFPPRESLVVTSWLGMGNSRTFFYGVDHFACLIRNLRASPITFCNTVGRT